VTDSHVEWEFNKGIPEVPSPILHEKCIYMVSNGGVLTCVEAVKGAMLYRTRLGGLGQYVASPVIAGNNLILASEEGLISVIRSGNEFEALGQFKLDESIQVTPALGRKTLYVRGKQNLWAFGPAKR
jgi:hypothetical protein